MSSQDEAMVDLSTSKFSAVDYAIFSVMLVVSIGIGVFSAFRNRHKTSTQQYLLGGRSMSPIPVVLSLIGGLTSAVSVLGTPTEVYFFGTQISTMLLGCIVGTVVLNHVILPIFYNLQIVSLNEYLELRFHSVILRKMGTICQLSIILMHTGMALYAPALALSIVTNLSTTASMIIMGSICTFYITIGGVKAVVYTDVLQTLLMFGGVLVVVILCCIDLGGVSEVWEISSQGSRLEFFNMDTSPFKRHTFWTTFVFGISFIFELLAFNQSSYQRFASVSSLKTAQRLGTSFLLGLSCLWITFFFSGLVAYATYSHCDPFTLGKIEKPDQIIPFLVTDKLSHLTGMAGLFIAAVYGAVMSTLSSNGNSMACLIWEDFLKEAPYFRRLSDRGATNVIKLLSLGAGVASICLGLFIGRLGNIFQVMGIVSSIVRGPLIGVYIAGICLPMVNTKGVTAGLVVSLAYSVSVGVGKFLRGGGSPPTLPLSIEGCPHSSLVNATITTFLSNATITTFLSNATLPQDLLLANTTLPVDSNASSIQGSGESSGTVFDISYCYSGIIGESITVLVAILISLCTGPVRPTDLKEGVVNPLCARLYKRLWRWIGREANSSHDNNKALKMLPTQNAAS